MDETEQTQLTRTEKPQVPERRRQPKRREHEGAEYTELPGTHITPNRLVAYNMAYWRKAAGYTQEELAQKLNVFYEKSAPWSNASVSAAERSWDGKRVRQFDADVILSLATIFGLPLIAFFLPPESDGVQRRYLLDLPHGDSLNQCTTMWDLIDILTHTGGSQWIEDEDDEEEYGEEGMKTLRTLQKVNERYRDRIDAALTFYRREVIEGGAEPTYAQEAWGVDPQEQVEVAELKYKLERTRQHYETLRQILGDIGAVQEDLHERLGLAYAERLPERLARTVVRRFRDGEDVKTIAKSIKKAEWLVEKALIDAREARLSYSAEERRYVFVTNKEDQERFERQIAANTADRRAEEET